VYWNGGSVCKTCRKISKRWQTSFKTLFSFPLHFLSSKVFLWPYPSFFLLETHKNYSHPQAQQIIEKHRLLTACGWKKKEFLLLISINSNVTTIAIVFVCIFSVPYANEMSKRSVKVIKLLTFIRYGKLNVNRELGSWECAGSETE
jgi:hypothetical protein